MRRSCTQRWGAGLCLVSCLALATEYGVAAAQDGVTSLNEMVAGSRVSIVTFGNISGVADSGWFGDGIAEAVAADLSRAADVLIDRRDATAPVLDTADAASRGREANARWVIHGGYQQQGSQIRITARLIDTESGAVVRAATVDGRLDELFALQDQIVPALGDGGTERTASVEADPGPPPTTRSLAPGGGLAAVAGAPPAPELPRTVTRNAAGQVTVRAVRIRDGLNLDGGLDEAVYGDIEPITNFIQFDPEAGAPATEQSEVWLLFDDNNLYVSARLHHSAPESEWIANEMRRDSFNVLRNEGFSFLLDTFRDRRNGIIFNVTPLGGRMDGQVTNERDYNGDWNPIWDVRTGRFDGGWTVEAEIPFKSLRYRPGLEQVWGVQLSRNIQSKNERAYLTPLDRGLGQGAIFQVSAAATLVGVEVPSGNRLFEVKPYVIGDVSSQLGDSGGLVNKGDGTVGLDVIKVGVTDNLTADFTVNTDFAQVEADTQQVNLTRFSLFFPEKREFFLENQGVFAFGGAGSRGPFGGSAETPIMFYSRRIGLSGGREVPLTAGGRMTGRAGRYSLGVLNIQTGSEAVSGTLDTNFTVARVKRDLFRRSSVGAILTNRTALGSETGTNVAGGVDASFAFYDNVLINAYWARTRTTDEEGKDSSYKGEFRYDGDRYGVTAEHLFIDERFSPGVGFIRRPDLKKSFGSARFSPRPESIEWIRRLSFDGSYGYFTDAVGAVETREAAGSFRMELENSDSFNAFFTNTYDFLQDPFRIADGVTIPVGHYDFSNTQVSYSFGPQRRLSGTVSGEHGSFYGGTKTAISIGGGFSGGRIEISPQFALEPGLSINRVDLPQGRFTTQLVTTRSTYTFSPTMFVSALVQYNSSNDAVSSNVRLRWEYQPGSELFIVYNEQRDTLTPGRFPDLENRAFIIKFNRLFRF